MNEGKNSPGPEPEISAMIFGCGVLGGVMATVFGIVAAGSSSSPWISAADSATLISGFGGAALGGGISWLLAGQAARQSMAREEKQRLDASMAVAASASLKLLVITNALYTFQRHISSARATRPPNARPHEVIRPITGLVSYRSHFLATDFQPFFQVDRGDIPNRALRLETRYEALVSTIQTYNREHLELQQMLAPYRPLNHDGLERIRIAADETTISLIATKTQVLDDLMTAVIKFVDTDYGEAQAICSEWDEILHGLFGKRFLGLPST